MNPYEAYVTDQADQQANRPDSPEKIPLDFSPFDLSDVRELRAELEGASLADIQAMLTAGEVTSVELVKHALKRAYDQQHLNLFLELNPDVLAHAAESDAERAAGQIRGPLHGIPVSIKGNIATADRMTTTAGAAVLRGLHAKYDAPLVVTLRGAGAIILGKNNLSEWANFYAERSVNGYSTLGGHTRHPLGAFDVGGSSSGSCAAVAAGVVPVAIGSETTGSIVYPSSQNGVVGLKPSLGLINGAGIIPITDAFDTAGPVGRTVADVALLATLFAAHLPSDAPAADLSGVDFSAKLSLTALDGVRVGLVRRESSLRAGDDLIRAQVVRRLEAAGAWVVDVPPMDEFIGKERAEQLGKDSLRVMILGFRLGVEEFLAEHAAPVRTMAEIAAFNAEDATNRIPSGQFYIQAAADADEGELAIYPALAGQVVTAYAEAVESALRAHNVEVMADFTNYASPYHSRAGFPAVTVPAGVRETGEPLGLTLFGTAFTDDQLLAYAYAFEAHA